MLFNTLLLMEFLLLWLSQCQQAEVLLGIMKLVMRLLKRSCGHWRYDLRGNLCQDCFLLSQGLRGSELTSWMSKSIAGELTSQMN